MTATTLSGSLVSVGYEGLSADELVATLVDQGVSVLVDVRLTPLSRKPGLSKTRLSEAVRGVGIEYVHLPGLGNPKENRDAFRRGEPESWEAFAQVLGSQRGQSALAHVAELLDGGTVALLCLERDHTRCHRWAVIDRIARDRPGLCVAHL